MDGMAAPLCPEGAHCMAMLRQHARSLGHAFISTESGAAEECEREVQQQDQEQAQGEVGREIVRLEPRAEKDWNNPLAVLKMRSVSEFQESQDKTKVRPGTCRAVAGVAEGSKRRTAQPLAAAAVAGTSVHHAAAICVDAGTFDLGFDVSTGLCKRMFAVFLLAAWPVLRLRCCTWRCRVSIGCLS